MTTIKEQIRAEIVRRMNAVNSTLLNEKYDDLLCFIDSLPDEQPSKDLEEEIATWLPKHIRVENKDYEYLKKPLAEWAGFIARHFAKWGAEHQVIDGNKMIEPSKDLEEAAEKKYPVYWKEYPKDGIARSESYYDTNKQRRDAFIAGAQWQAEHTKDYPMPEDTVLFQMGVEEGKRLMMEDAIEGKIIETYNPVTEEGKPYLHGITLIYEDKNKPYLTVGDMFKFTIIKEEDEK